MNYEKLPKTISAEELLSTPLPPVKWIIPDLLPAGLALFAGPSKAGKSWLTLWLCLQVAQGKPMWGREIEPHTVLYLSLEDTFNRLQKRLLQLVGSEEAPERLVMQTECGSIGQGLEEQLTSFIYQHPDTGLIVIDTLQKVRSSDQNNSMYASDYKEISALKALADWVRQFYVSLYIPPKPVAAAFFRLRGVIYLYITYYISIRIWCQYWCQWCQTLSRHQFFQKCSARSVPSIRSVLPHRFPLSF